MESQDVFHQLFKKVSPKQIAPEMGLKPSIIYKWAGTGESHRKNPAEQLEALMRLTNDLSLLHWLCERCGGYFVANPTVKVPARAEFLAETGGVMYEMGHLQAAVAEALRDGKVTKEEAVEVRNLWEQLKSDMERYATGCDRGEFCLPNAAASPARV